MCEARCEIFHIDTVKASCHNTDAINTLLRVCACVRARFNSALPSSFARGWEGVGGLVIHAFSIAAGPPLTTNTCTRVSTQASQFSRPSIFQHVGKPRINKSSSSLFKSALNLQHVEEKKIILIGCAFFKKTTSLPSPRDRWERLRRNPATLSRGRSGVPRRMDGWIYLNIDSISGCAASHASGLGVRVTGCCAPFQPSASEGGASVWCCKRTQTCNLSVDCGQFTLAN